MTDGQHTAARDPDRLRAVALVGHPGAGKTTLVEALLAAAGAIAAPGDVQDGTTTSDSDPVERELGHSVSVGVTALEHRGCLVQLLDTPGSVDFVGARQAGLRAADAVLFVVSAAGGLDAASADLWARCEAEGLPRAVVVTQLDRARADHDETVALCQRLLSEDVLPVHLPMHDDDGAVAGLISLLDHRVTDHSGGQRRERAADPEHLALVADLRAELVEAVLAEAEDDTLLDDYVEGREPPAEVLVAELHRAVASGVLTPSVACAPLAEVGVRELLDLVVEGFPSPLERDAPPVTRPDGSPAAPLRCDPAGPLAAEVLRVDAGHAWVRVWSGTLRTGDALLRLGPDDAVGEQVRPDALGAPLGADLRDVPACAAGSICAVRGAGSARPGDTLSSPGDPLRLQAWGLPAPQHPVALEPAGPTGPDQLAAALGRLAAQDPTVRLEHGEPTGQLLLWCTGPDAADALLRRLRRDVQVQVADVALPPDSAWSTIEVHVPDAFAGTVRSDLSGRRARDVTVRPDPYDDGRSVVQAQLPDAELLGYAVALRRIAHGTAHFTRRPAGPTDAGSRAGGAVPNDQA